MRRILSIVGVFVLFGFVATACDSKSGDNESEGTKKEKTAKQKTEKSDKAGTKKVSLKSVGNKFKYDKTEIEVKPGQKVQVSLQNNADKGVKHNFVQLNTNDDATAKKIAQEGMKNQDNDYLPKGDLTENIIANTSMADSGATVEVTFTAPEEPGKYKYICTFPGHYPQMQGTLIVKG